VTLDHDGDSGPCEVNLDHTTVPYDKGERVIVFATITVPPLQTGNGYVHLQGFGIYKIHKEKKNWMDAMQTCTKENAHLLIVNSENEFSALKLLGKLEGPYHTSINDLYKEGQFVTQFGDSLNTTGYIKWYPNEPNQGAAGNCVRIFSSGLMADDERCYDDVQTSVILLRSGLAYSGYSNLTKFFMSSYRNLSGHWMAQVTLDHDGDSGPCEVNLDHTTVPYEKGERVIVFATITGDSLNTTGYIKWNPNEPNQGAAGNCVRIFSSGLMADDECNMSYSFICERKLI
ncbi:hypothetical protein C0J52_27771, partial [Blattella germanica]